MVRCERHGGPPVAFVPGSRARAPTVGTSRAPPRPPWRRRPAAAGTTPESSSRTTRRRLASSYAGSVTRPDVVDLALVAGCLGLAAWSTVAGGETLFTGVFIAFVYSCLAVLGRAGVAGALRVRREATRARELARTDPRELARAAISEERERLAADIGETLRRTMVTISAQARALDARRPAPRPEADPRAVTAGHERAAAAPRPAAGPGRPAAPGPGRSAGRSAGPPPATCGSRRGWPLLAAVEATVYSRDRGPAVPAVVPGRGPPWRRPPWSAAAARPRRRALPARWSTWPPAGTGSP